MEQFLIGGTYKPCANKKNNSVCFFHNLILRTILIVAQGWTAFATGHERPTRFDNSEHIATLPFSRIVGIQYPIRLPPHQVGTGPSCCKCQVSVYWRVISAAAVASICVADDYRQKRRSRKKAVSARSPRMCTLVMYVYVLPYQV